MLLPATVVEIDYESPTMTAFKSCCPLCSDVHTFKLGRIPEAFHFCETEFSSPVNPGSLVKCNNCGLRWRDPLPNQAALLDLYQKTSSAFTWGGDYKARKDFELVAGELNSRHCSHILEIGCSDGSLACAARQMCTNSLMHWFGIEPSADAAAVAVKNNVKILGASIKDSSLSESRYVFDAIIAVDVFEHLVDMHEFFSDAIRLLRPSGFLIIATGAIDSLPENLQSRWNYVAMPEHMCFLTKRTVEYICQHYGLRLASYESYSHLPDGNLRLRFKLMLKSILSFILGFIPWNILSTRLRKLRSVGWIPVNIPDHCIVTFKVLET
jgi:SAM-dependent methyltransferase